MNFQDRYNSEKEEGIKADPNKITLSNDAYAIAELLNNIEQRLLNSK